MIGESTPSSSAPLPAPSNVEGGCCGGCSSPSSPPVPPPILPPPPPILAVSTPAVPPNQDTCGGSCCGDEEEESDVDEDGCGCCEKKEGPKEVEEVSAEEGKGACQDSCCGDEEDGEELEADAGCCSGPSGACQDDGFDDEDDDSLCPCCVKVVLEHAGSIGMSLSDASAKLLLPPNSSKNTFPLNPNASALERLLGRMRKCCRVLETLCKGLDCCFVPESRTRRSVAPPIISTCKQVDDEDAKAEPLPSSTSTFGTHPLALEITGMDCIDCLPKVNRALSRLPSVKPVDLDYLSGLSTLAYDQEVITPEAIARYVARATGFDVKPVGRGVDGGGGSTSRITLPLKFSRVPPPEVLDKLNARQRTELGGFFEVSFDSQGEKARQPRDVVAELEPFGPELLPVAALEGAKDRVAQDLRRIGLRTLAASVLSIPVLVFAWASLPPHPLAYGVASVVLTTVIQIVGFPIISGSVRSLVYLREVDMNVLVSLSTLTAYVFSVVAFGFEVAGKPFTDPFFETVALLISLIYVGRLVQAATRRSASSAIRALQQLQSTEVVLVEQVGKEVIERQLDSRLLHYGDILRIRADSRIPTDGIVVSGSGEVDESSATGESLPSLKQVGSPVIAGSLNLNGSLDIQITQLVHENSLARVTGLVRQAQSSRSRFQDVADRFAALILPIAATSAIISFVVWILVNRFGKGMSTSSSVVNALTYALSILIISCPCAIGLAVPLVVASSQRAGLREGVLFRSSEALQTAHSTDTLAFDKTGTLSQGNFSIERTEVLFPGVERIILSLVASNTHPISKAILSLFSPTSPSSSSLPPPTLEDLVSLPGMGMKATFRSYPLLGGSPTFTSTSHLPLIKDLTSLGLTLFTVTLGGELVAAIGLADVARPESAALIADLIARGKHVVVLSGDNKGAVERFARSIHLPLEDVRASCSPKDKATFIAELQQQGHRVAFVGDGTNDGPALAQANLAISIASGSEVAVAASGVVLLGDKDLRRSVLAVLDLASHARQHMIASLVWCLVYFVFALLLTSGAFVRFRIEPQWAGLGEVVSVLPVVAIGLGLDARWRRRRGGGK